MVLSFHSEVGSMASWRQEMEAISSFWLRACLVAMMSLCQKDCSFRKHLATLEMISG